MDSEITDHFLRVAIGTDHAGYQYKEAIARHLRDRGLVVIDCGTNSDEPVDYPLFVRPAAELVARGEAERGIVLGGSGNGEAIAANKVGGIRCAVCWDEETARLGRAHNDANVIAIGARMISLELALRIVDIFLVTPFDGGRHARRIAMLEAPPDHSNPRNAEAK